MVKKESLFSAKQHVAILHGSENSTAVEQLWGQAPFHPALLCSTKGCCAPPQSAPALLRSSLARHQHSSSAWKAQSAVFGGKGKCTPAVFIF